MSLVETFVTQWLPEADADFLTGLCDEFRVIVPDHKAGKHQELLKLVLRYLSSETLEQSPDQGAAVYLKLFSELGTALGKGKVQPKIEPDSAEGGRSAVPVSPTVRSTYTRLQPCKINGTINGGKEGTLSFTSLHCQLLQAEAAHYSLADIIAAVIRAIPAGNSFRDMLEARGEMTRGVFIQLLQSHFKEKDADSVLKELLNCYQKPGQDAHDFCCSAMSLRDRLKMLSEQEGKPWDPDQLRTRLYHAIFTGLKQTSIRMELQSILKEASMEDADFLQQVALAEANEKERLSKVSDKTKAEVKAVQAEDSDSKSSGKTVSFKKAGESENKMLAQVLAKVEQLSTHTQEQSNKIQELEKRLSTECSRPNPQNFDVTNDGNRQFAGNTGNTGYRPQQNWQPRRRFYGCKKCEEANSSYCNHCFKCGSTDHKKFECQEN